ncbi:MAG TPA: DUF3137 domain-containing protein [Allosphingosinicella sp.]|jgi:hypothetical protein
MSFTAADFATLCEQGPVAEQIGTIEERRQKALSRFRTVLVGGLAAAAVLAWLVGTGFNPVAGVMTFVGLGILLFIIAMLPLGKAGTAIKHPTLHALAAQGGMSFTPDGFEPPAFEQAKKPLFGGWLSSATFTDLFYGTAADGKRFAFYEATLTQGHGKHRSVVFTGQIYAYERSRTQTGDIVAVPDRGLFNFFKPAGGFRRVRIEGDEAFEKAFEIYAIDEMAARMMFAGNADARRLLLDLRTRGKLFLFIGPDDVLAAIAGGDRYEPGSMFASKSGEERVRIMFDDVCQAMDIVKRLKAAFG